MAGPPDQRDDGTRWRRWRIAIFASTWYAYAGLYFSRKAFYAVKKPLSDDLGFDELDLATVGIAYLVAYTIGQFVSAAAGQRFGARILLLTGLFVAAGTNIVFGFSNNLWTIGAFMVVNGFAQSTGWCACMGTLGEWTTRRERGTIMSFWATCYQLGSILATNWAGLWLGLQGWRGSFFAGAAVTFGAWIVVHLFQRNSPGDEDFDPLPADGVNDDVPAGGEVREEAGWTRPIVITTLLVGLCYVGIKFIRYAVWSWSAYFLDDYYHVASEQAAYYSTLFDVGGFLGVVVAGIVSDKVFRGRRATLSFWLLGMMLVGCILLYVLGTNSLMWFLVSMLIVGFSLYGPDSLLSGAGAIEVGSRRTAIAAAGIINGMGSAGAVIQELLVAVLYRDSEGAVGPVLAMLVGASCLSLASLAVVLVRNRRGVSDL